MKKRERNKKETLHPKSIDNTTRPSRRVRKSLVFCKPARRMKRQKKKKKKKKKKSEVRTKEKNPSNTGNAHPPNLLELAYQPSRVITPGSPKSGHLSNNSTSLKAK